MIQLNTIYGFEGVRDYYHLSGKRVYNSERDSYLDNKKTSVKLSLKRGGYIYCNPRSLNPTKLTKNLVTAVVLFIADRLESLGESKLEFIHDDTRNKFMISRYQLDKILNKTWRLNNAIRR